VNYAFPFKPFILMGKEKTYAHTFSSFLKFVIDFKNMLKVET